MHTSESMLFEEISREFRSFLDVPVCREADCPQAKVAFLGVPYAIPYRAGQRAASDAPDYIRQKSFRVKRAVGKSCNFDWDMKPFSLGGLRMVDCGNIRSDPMDFPGTVKRAETAVRRLLDNGVFPVVFGGDDAVPIPVVRAYEGHGPLTVVQIDEHMDFADEVGGIREGYSSPMRRVCEMPWVEQIIHLGTRSFGVKEQVEATRAAGNLIIPAFEFHEKGVDSVLKRIKDGGKYFISLDFDGLDPACFPAVSNPEPGGLSFGQTCRLLRGLAKKGKVAGIVMAEMVPAHDLNGISGYCAGRLAVNLLHAVFLPQVRLSG